MVLEILCVEPIYPQYSGVLETCLALRYWFFEVLGSESVKLVQFSLLTFLNMYNGSYAYNCVNSETQYQFNSFTLLV